MMFSKKKRINWVDSVKGFGIILVVYGHNYPVLEGYIYNFHMPLFFFLSGLFHPNKVDVKTIKKRAKQILAPYFLWSFLLFLFWFFVGRKFGDSSLENYSPLNNFLGIFYAQGDHEFMNWGIPLWFLPSIFLSFLTFGMITKLKKKYGQILVIILLISLGFCIPRFFEFRFIWSIDVSFVSLFFYAIAFYLKDFFLFKKIKREIIMLFFLGLLHIICAFYINQKIDMYRATYGNEFLFLLNAIIGISFWVLFFKKIKKINFLSFLGKNTISILALHLRSITVIKVLLLIFWTSKSFDFNEIEKVILVVLQLLVMYPLIIFINKKAPILNGKTKVLETRN
ncbi:MAG: acyltransferase family protein [Polaribacter sp.]